MPQIRILLVDMPRLVREMIDAAVQGQPDMHVVETTADPSELVAAARRVRPSFVILGIERDALPNGCLQLFDEQPKVKLLGIEAEAGRAYLWQLRPERRPLGEISPAGVVEAIRAAVPAGAG